MTESIDEFTKRELDVIEAIKLGCIDDDAVARRLGISPNTAHCHILNICNKLDIGSRQQRAYLVYGILTAAIVEFLKKFMIGEQK